MLLLWQIYKRELPTISTLKLDLTDESAGEQLLFFTLRKHGRVDILFNNAGIFVNSTFQHLSLDVIERIIAVNLVAPIAMAKVFLPHFIENNNGIIAFTGSIAAHIHSPQNSVYTASKAGLHGFVAAARRELPANCKVRLSIIHPGTTRTGFFTEADLKALGNVPMHSPDDVARALLHGVARGRNEILVTLKDRMSVWIERVFPTYFDARFRGLSVAEERRRETE